MQFRSLDRYKVSGTEAHMNLAIPLPRTPSGRIYRLSPNLEAYPRHFLIGQVAVHPEATAEMRARMKLEPRSENTVCPYSGIVAADDAFVHPDDIQASIDTVAHAAHEDIAEAINQMLGNVARKSKFISYKPAGRRAKPRPRFGRSDLLRELICDHCGRDYGVYAIALFCPDCGAPNVRLHFERERILVAAQVDLAEAQGEGLEELAYRLLGNAHEDVLTAFEATQKTVFLYGMVNGAVPATKLASNSFQNVEKAQRLFAQLGLNPFDHLTPHEASTLALNIQKRHVIGHNLGVVDSKFAEHAQEAKVGETVRLVADDIREFAAICQTVIDRLDAWLVGAPSPTIGMEFPPLLTASPAGRVTDRAPTLESLNVKLGKDAREFGLWFAKQSANGNPEDTMAEEDAMKAAFPELSDRAMTRVVAELEAEGLVRTAGSGWSAPIIFATTDLFAIFDPIVSGNDPYEDALELTVRILELAENSDDSIDPAKLHDELDWGLRRFNPALSIVVAHVGSRRVSNEYGGDYVTRGFFLLPEDEIALERLAERIKGRCQ